ncbi:MAG TPA: hypothetical protein VKS20_11390 [Candidatus Acidoferrales bacterium]|nr:hypothetical protein [Candidatus Acidoferrales bacterium]
MDTKITYDFREPAASLEFMITKLLADYDLFEVEAETPRDVDPVLASQGFKDLLDDARAILERELASSGLEIAQLTGAICNDGKIHRPGIWLVVRESKSENREMSPEARSKVVAAAESLRSGLGLS